MLTKSGQGIKPPAANQLSAILNSEILNFKHNFYKTATPFAKRNQLQDYVDVCYYRRIFSSINKNNCMALFHYP